MTGTDSIQGKARSRKWLKWLLLVPLALLVLCAMLLMSSIALSRIFDPVTRSTDCGRVALAFADALMEGDAHLARSLAITDAGIDDWMAVRRGFSCPFSLDIEAYDSSMVCGYSQNGSDKWSCGFHYFCRLNGAHGFTLDAIELAQKPEGCRVTYWSEPCEAFGWEELGSGKCR